MTAEEKRNKIIDDRREKRRKYSEEEITLAIKKTAGALSALKDIDFDEVRKEAILCK